MSKIMAKTLVRVLLVEDDAIDRLACRRALAQHPDYDFHLIEAETGRQGMQLLHEQHPDLVLLDYRLPDQDGLEFLAELKHEEGTPGALVVMLTGFDDVGVAVAAMKRGARDYLVKDNGREYLGLLPAVVERALREQRLDMEKRAAEARYRALVEQIPAIAYTAAPDMPGHMLYISPQIGTLGYTVEEWLADGLLKHVHPEDSVRLIDALTASCGERKPLRCEYRLFARNGETRWFLDEATIVEDAPGAPMFLQGVLVDITEDKRREEELDYHRRRLEELVGKRTAQLEKQADLLRAANVNLMKEIDERRDTERALRVSEQRFRLLLESAGEGIYGLDAEGRCTFVNDAALQMLGFAREDLLGQPMHERILRGRADGMSQVLDEHRTCAAFRTGTPQRGLVETLWRQDGSTFTAEYSSYPLRENDNIAGAVVVFRDVTEASAAAEQLAHQASHDALTGLLNRQEFERRLDRVLGDVKRDGGEHALCYLDLDQFKVVNDSCGHAAGDELLRQVSALLQEKMRSRDALARLGGDEFGILLEHCPLQQALRIAHDLCEAVRSFRFLWKEKVFAIGVSIGVAELTSGADTFATALRAADAACYAAKEKGRNRVHVYQTGSADHSAHMHWVSRLTQALDEDRFELWYQSIAPVGGHVAERPHYEILLRLVDEQGRRIEPDAFIPTAERYNLMPAIDRWVLRHVLAGIAAHHWQTPAERWPIYAINISGASLNARDLADFIGQLLAEHGVPGHALCIEISETAASESLVQTIHFVQEIKKLGCLFSVDDFGSGMHWFTHLKPLAVDFLKIDGSFIRSITHDRVVHAIAESISRLAHVMAIQTVAECAEDEDVLQRLLELGVDCAQGYAIMRPQPLTQLPEPSAVAFAR